MDKQLLAKMIDHTILKADATQYEIEKICREALEYNFCSVCLNPYWVKYASTILKDSDIKICTVIGFPLGASMSEAKAKEASLSIDAGASEVDMVLNIGLLKSGKIKEAFNDIKMVRDASKGKVLKVIIETCLLTDEEKKQACEMSKEAAADFVKTSTGFSTAGAKIDDIKLMRSIVGSDMGVKASGGVRSYQDVLNFYEAGANRFGTSAGVDIMNGLISSSSY